MLSICRVSMIFTFGCDRLSALDPIFDVSGMFRTGCLSRVLVVWLAPDFLKQDGRHEEKAASLASSSSEDANGRERRLGDFSFGTKSLETFPPPLLPAENRG